MKIIAEIGVNHNSSIKIAKKLILECSKNGIDFVKFQMFDSSETVTNWSKKADYQSKNLGNNISQQKMLKKYQLNFKNLKTLRDYSKKNNINFLVSVFDIKSFKKFLKLNLKILKIPSGEIINYPLLKMISKYNLTVILSTGMASENEIRNAVKILTSDKIKKNNITILHCNTDYPTRFNEVNLRYIERLKKKFNTTTGYSDHTKGILVPLVCASREVDFLEKHITLNNKLKGPDHKASLEIKNIASMMRKIRDIKSILGLREKIINRSEINNAKYVRKSLIAKKNIKKGEKFSINNIGLKRPGYGISGKYYFKILKKISKYNFKKDELIKI